MAISEDNRKKVIYLYRKGYSRDKIKNELKLGSDTVQSVINELKEEKPNYVKEHVHNINPNAVAQKRNNKIIIKHREEREQSNLNYKLKGYLIFKQDIEIANSTDKANYKEKPFRTTSILSYGINSQLDYENYQYELERNRDILETAYLLDTSTMERNYLL